MDLELVEADHLTSYWPRQPAEADLLVVSYWSEE